MPRRRDDTAWMWIEACERVDRASRLQRQVFRLGVEAAAWEPPVDVFEDEHGFVIVAAMPGVPADRVRVSIEGPMLVLRGVRPLRVAGPGLRVRQLEIPYGTFERAIPLPAARLEVGTPELAEGCLVLRLRKLAPEVR